jgi:tRNA dimethylallyltransferase
LKTPSDTALSHHLERVLMQHEAAGAASVFAFVGPTASGKTELAVALAERLHTSVISVDSVQVYRHFNIGTGKPTETEQARARHDLVDIIEPEAAMDAALYGKLADACIAEHRATGEPIVLCGGSYLWLKTLLWGLAEAPPRTDVLRAKYNRIVQEQGTLALHAMLCSVDPVIAARLHPNDVVRVSRALEVFESTGQKLSALQQAHAFKSPRYPSLIFARRRSAEDARARIEARVDLWLQSGWVEETRALIAKGYAKTRPMTSVGYAEIHAFLRGEIAEFELRDKIVHSTWVFARRQRTWMNHEPVIWLDG